MEEDIKKLTEELAKLRKEFEDFKQETEELTDTFSGKKIINYEVQFLKPVKDKNGVTQIN